MPNEESSSRKTVAAAGFILLAFMMVSPGLLLCAPSWTFRFFETGTIVLAATGISLMFPRRVLSLRDHLPRGLLIAAGTLLAIGLWHGIRNAGRYNAAETGELFLTALFPFCVCVFAREIRRFLPWCLTFLWLIDIVLGFIQYYGLHWFLFGLPQNINWNASFLAVSAPFAILTAWRRSPSGRNRSANSLWRIGSAVFVVAVTLWQIALTESRGAILGILAAGALWGFLKLSQKGRRVTLFAGLTLAIVGSFWLAFFAPHDRILEQLSRDERVYMANTTVDMIADRPNFGFGAPSFMQEYLRFRTPEFFAMRHSAATVEHPHNHPLYIAASFGILGLICWLYLVLEPMFFAARRFDAPDFGDGTGELNPGGVTKLSLLCLAGLLVHSQFDLVLFRWPTNLLAMIFLGLLIHEREGAPAPFWRPPAFLRRFRWEFLTKLERPRRPEHRTARLVPPALFTIGAVLFGLGMFFAFSNLAAEAVAWRADGMAYAGNQAASEGLSARAESLHAEASRLYLMAASMPGSSLPLKYRALNHASVHDPDRARNYYAMFASSSTPDFGFVNDSLAIACWNSGLIDEAIPFIKRAMTLRPHSVRPLVMLMDVYKMREKQGAVDAVRERLEILMEYRRLDEADVKFILQNEGMDLHTWFRRDPVLMMEYMSGNNWKDNNL